MLLSAGAAWAGAFEDGVAAQKNGDYTNALRIFTSLAAQGDARAQYNLGVMYQYGQGVGQYNVRAYMWFNLAAALGNVNAAKSRDIVATRMTPQQIAEAQETASDCQRRNFKGCD